MAGQRRLDRDLVVKSAIQLADQHGLDGLELQRVASDLGVGPSALYHHIDGLHDLSHEVAIQATANLAGCLREAAVARTGADALRAMAIAYRQFANQHPGQYAATLLPPTASDDRLIASHRQIIDLLVRVLAVFGLTGTEAVHAARMIRSAVHGFVALEVIDAFVQPESHDVSFEVMVDRLIGSVTS